MSDAVPQFARIAGRSGFAISAPISRAPVAGLSKFFQTPPPAGIAAPGPPCRWPSAGNHTGGFASSGKTHPLRVNRLLRWGCVLERQLATARLVDLDRQPH